MEHFISRCINNRLIIVLLTSVLFVGSLWSLTQLKLDAVPDLSDTQVIIQAEYAGQPPQVMEDQVTYPLTTRMLSVPYAKTVRGYSFFGFSLIYILFEDGTDLYWARSRVLEYLNSMQGKLPSGVTMELGPDATAIGWIFQYALQDTTGRLNLADLRDLQDYLIRYELTAVEGVSEVASLGGFKRQFQVEVNPSLLLQYKVSLHEIETALKRGNMEMGARLVEQAETEFMVLVKGYVDTVDDIREIPIRTGPDGNAIQIGDIAVVGEGPDIRRGLADLDGKGEVVGGIVVMRQGEDVPDVTARIKKRIEALRSSLPKGVEIVTTYDRSELIEEAVGNLAFKLFEELLVVAVVTFIFLLHVRSALVALVVLPLGVLCSFMLMYLLGVPANIMSMGGVAIAVGVMVDASVVMVENTHKHLEDRLEGMPWQSLTPEDYWDIAKTAAVEVAPGLFWSMVIIIFSFLPVFVLPEQSGRMFIPLALTKTLAMVSAAILAVTLIPVLIGWFIRGNIRKEKEHPVSRFLIRIYNPILSWCLDNKRSVLYASVVAFIFSMIPLFGIPNPLDANRPLVSGIGSEFMPPLEEGDLLYMPTTVPGISVSKAREILIKTDQMIMRIPEVKRVFGKIGRADTATDPAPLTMIETTILLKDKSEWRSGVDLEDIIDELDKTVRLPGLVNAWTMPIKTRIDMLSTGIKTPIGVKVMGNDLAKLQKIAGQLEGRLSGISGVSSVFGERTRGGNYITYRIDRNKAAQYGINIADIQQVLTIALGGRPVTEIIKGQNRWTANIRYQRSYRENLQELNNIYIPLPGKKKGQIPISEILIGGSISVEKGPAVIKTENARKTSWLYVDTRSGDIGGLVEKIRHTIDSLIESKQIDWGEGYSYIISGQYEQMALADKRMSLIIPLVLLSVFLILYLYFKNFSSPGFVMSTTLFFAPLGGIWAMYLFGFNRSVASDVGFIALIGLSAETGVLMLVYLNSELNRHSPASPAALRDVILTGAVLRVRPKMMTVATTLLALMPLFWGDEPGNTAMRRIALPMVGGLITDTIVTLILVPLFYEWWHGRDYEKQQPQAG